MIEPHIEGTPDPSKFKVDGKELTLNIRGKEEVKLDWGGKLVFYNCIVGGAIDARFLPAILKGIMEKWRKVHSPDHTHVISELLYTMARCTRLTPMKFLSDWLVEMLSKQPLKMLVQKSWNLFTT